LSILFLIGLNYTTRLLHKSLERLTIFNAGCNPAKNKKTVPFLAGIRQMADRDKNIFWSESDQSNIIY
jgi:hypothetical protein